MCFCPVVLKQGNFISEIHINDWNLLVYFFVYVLHYEWTVKYYVEPLLRGYCILHFKLPNWLVNFNWSSTFDYLIFFSTSCLLLANLRLLFFLCCISTRSDFRFYLYVAQSKFNWLRLSWLVILLCFVHSVTPVGNVISEFHCS